MVAAAANAALGLLSAPEFLAGVRDGAFLGQSAIRLAGRTPRHQRGAGPGPHVGPGIDPGGDAGGGGLPGAGLLVNCTQGNVIRLLPPLVITDQELDAAMAILREALKAVFP